jgi:hypothetical protein
MPVNQQAAVGPQWNVVGADLQTPVTHREPVGAEQVLRHRQGKMRHDIAVDLPQQRNPPRRSIGVGRQVDDTQPARLLCQHRNRQFHSGMSIRRLSRIRRLHRDRGARLRLRRDRSGLSLEQHRQEHVACRLQVIGKRLVEFFRILVRLEEHHIEHDGSGAGLLEIPHDIAESIARPGPAPECLEARFIDGE